jgi:hypothetical protein
MRIEQGDLGDLGRVDDIERVATNVDFCIGPPTT